MEYLCCGTANYLSKTIDSSVEGRVQQAWRQIWTFRIVTHMSPHTRAVYPHGHCIKICPIALLSRKHTALNFPSGHTSIARLSRLCHREEGQGHNRRSASMMRCNLSHGAHDTWQEKLGHLFLNQAHTPHLNIGLNLLALSSEASHIAHTIVAYNVQACVAGSSWPTKMRRDLCRFRVKPEQQQKIVRSRDVFALPSSFFLPLSSSCRMYPSTSPS